MSAVPTGKTKSGEQYWLEQIAHSPSSEHSGFHHKAIAGAKWRKPSYSPLSWR